jgi:hypothetical protein
MTHITGNRLLVRGPHSHSARRRFCQAFEMANLNYDAVVITLGMHGRGYTIPDTPEALELARCKGATLAREQWKHLREDSTVTPTASQP